MQIMMAFGTGKVFIKDELEKKKNGSNPLFQYSNIPSFQL
jgi:hypothetical protein